MPDHDLSAGTHAGAAVPRHVAAVTRSVNVVEVIDEAEIGRTQILVLTVCALVAISMVSIYKRLRSPDR